MFWLEIKILVKLYKLFYGGYPATLNKNRGGLWKSKAETAATR